MKTLILLILLSQTAHAEINRSDAIQAIVGEAADQPYIGQVALAEAIRNRGTLQGVYGFNRDTSKETGATFQRAARAWEESKETNLLDGRDHWENVEVFGLPYWADETMSAIKIGDHTFFGKKQA